MVTCLVPFNGPGSYSYLGREADSLPYGGWGILGDAIQRWVSKMLLFSDAKTSPDGAGKLLDSYSPKGVTKKPVTNGKTVTGFFANLGGSGRLLAGHARERFHLGIQ